MDAKATYRGGVFTDLDGTLLDSASRLSSGNAAALRAAGERGLVRVAVTGRSLYSALKVMDESTPLDYLVASSGVAVYSWPARELLVSWHIDARAVRRGTRALLDMGVDFKVFDPVPDNHFFAYWRAGGDNPDFEDRMRRYPDVARPFDPDAAAGPAAQLLVISRPGDDIAALHAELLDRFADFNVVRATSPLDHVSMWFEFFPAGVSKGAGAEWLRRRLQLPTEHCLAVGNDYNDLSLLKWCRHPYVVANAPTDLRARFAVVAGHDEDGVADALETWHVEGKAL